MEFKYIDNSAWVVIFNEDGMKQFISAQLKNGLYPPLSSYFFPCLIRAIPVGETFFSGVYGQTLGKCRYATVSLKLIQEFAEEVKKH